MVHCSVHPQFSPFCPQCIVLSRKPVAVAVSVAAPKPMVVEPAKVETKTEPKIEPKVEAAKVEHE